MLKIVFKLCCCLGFANHDSQTKKTTSWTYIRLFTVHSTVCPIYARANHTIKKPRERTYVIIILWLRSMLVLSSTLGELAYIFNTYLFKNFFRQSCTPPYLIFFVFGQGQELSLLIIHGLQKVPVTKLSFNKKANKLSTILEDSSWQ